MNTIKHQSGRHQSGLSLVEVLVALVISLFLLTGIVQVYLSNRVSYTFSEAISRIQENGRFALDTMTQDLRMVGFFGCAIFDPADTSTLVNSINPGGTGYSAAIYDFIGQGPIQGTLENLGLNGSDTITLRGAKPDQVTIHPPFNVATSDPIEVTTSTSIEVGDIVMVTNCSGGDIFQITGIGAGTFANQDAMSHIIGGSELPGNFNPGACGVGHCLSQTYGSESSMFELQTVTYTIAVGASGEPALWRTENSSLPVELIEGIEQMQILYGIDTDGDNFANRYVVSTGVADWLTVSSIRLMLVVVSDTNEITEAAQVYNYNGASITAPDLRLRQVFSATIALRNRTG